MFTLKYSSSVNQVLATVLCMLVQTTNEKSSEYQTTMGFYLLACGASWSQFDVLNHTRICLSYHYVLCKIKTLGQEQLAKIRKIAKTRMFMIIWDNLNFAFRVAQQRVGSRIFHEKVAATQMTVNEYWGSPNSKALWSLWKVNSLLGHKPMTADWKAKKLPPFRPSLNQEINVDLFCLVFSDMLVFLEHFDVGP
jgi:hypothetical protein